MDCPLKPDSNTFSFKLWADTANTVGAHRLGGLALLFYSPDGGSWINQAFRLNVDAFLKACLADRCADQNSRGLLHAASSIHGARVRHATEWTHTKIKACFSLGCCGRQTPNGPFREDLGANCARENQTPAWKAGGKVRLRQNWEGSW